MELGKTRNCVKTIPPCERPVSTQFSFFPISTRVGITVYQHGKCFIFLKYDLETILIRIFVPVYTVFCTLKTQPRSQGLRGETVTKTLVKFVLSFQNFGKKFACAVRHNRIAITVEYGCVSLRMRFFSQNFGTIKRILPGSSSPSHRESPGTEVAEDHEFLVRCSNRSVGSHRRFIQPYR